MAVIKASCPRCNKAFGVLEHQMGTEVQCPNCKSRIKIPKPASSRAASSGAESALDAAAAQLGGPSKPKPRGDGLDDLLAATQEKPGAAQKPAPKPEPVESRPAHGHTAAHSHPGSPELGHPAPAAKGLMGNPGVLFTLVGGLLLVIVVIIYFIFTNNAEAPDLDHGVFGGNGQSQAGGSTPGGLVPAAKSAAAVAAALKMGAEARGSVPTYEAITPLLLDMDKDKPEAYFGRKGVLARFGTAQNTSSELVERAAVTISVWDDKKMMSQKTFTFRDVQPGQKMGLVVEYPYTDAKPQYRVVWRKWSPEKPIYKFEASVLGVRANGEVAGTVTVGVTNQSELAAPVVDILVIMTDTNTRERTGYVTATIKDLKPHETRDVPILWDGFESDVITGGEAYAQIGGPETE